MPPAAAFGSTGRRFTRSGATACAASSTPLSIGGGVARGIFINQFEIGAIGPDLFRAACKMGLEGLVSKRSDRPYRGGKSLHWIKIKNRTHPAMMRVAEAKTCAR
jgi:hypothetical protein